MSSKKIAILTGGGEVPGLNVCLKSLVYRLIDENFDPIGVRKGWEGFIGYNYQDPTTYGSNFIELSKALIRPIDRSSGSFLHSSRLNPKEFPTKRLPAFLTKGDTPTQDLTAHIKNVIERLGFHAIIVIGDQKTLEYAAHLSAHDVPIIAIPKTIHNNIYGTDYTIGYTTGLARGVAFIHELRALAGSREQIMVVETFRINSGLSSLMLALLAGVDRAVIPEVHYDPEKLARLLLQDKERNPSNYAVVTVCDGSQIIEDKILEYTPSLSLRSKSRVLRDMTASKAVQLVTDDDFLLEEVVETGSSLAGSGMVVAELLTRLTNSDVFLQSLTYLLRTGFPDGQDLLGATNFALLAVRLLKAQQFGQMTAYHHYELTQVDLNLATQPKQVNLAEMYDIENYLPKINLMWAAQE